MLALTLATVVWMTSSPEVGRREEAEAVMRLGNDALRASQADAALREYQRAYELFPSERLFYNFGLAYNQAGRKREALDAFERFLRAFDDNSRDSPEDLASQVANARSYTSALIEADLASVDSPAQAATPSLECIPMPVPKAPPRQPILLNERGQPPPLARRPSALYRMRWWLAGGALIAGATTTFFIIRSRKNDCPPGLMDCF